MRKLFAAVFFCVAFASTAAVAQNDPLCVSDLKLTEGRENWYNLFENRTARSVLQKVGTWRADTLGAGDAERPFGDTWVTLSAQLTPQSSRQCLTDFTVQATEDWNAKPNLQGEFVLVGYFDVRRGGGKDSFNKVGDDKFTLSYRRMLPTEKPDNIFKSVNFSVTATEDLLSTIMGGSEGLWDVDNGEAAGADGRYDYGGLVMLSGTRDFFTPASSDARLVYSGMWVRVHQCGGTCSSGTHEVTHGVTAGKDFAERKEVQSAIEATIGASTTVEASASVPIQGIELGVSASTTLSASTTGSYSKLEEASVLRTFSETNQVTTTINCVPPYALWQWQVTLKSQSSPESTTARVDLFNCTDLDDQPANLHDIAWIPRQSKLVGADATAAATPSSAKDGPLRTADGRTLPADKFVEYRGIWSFGSGEPSVDANLVFYLQPIDGKSGHYCYNLGSTPSCDYITYVYSEPEKKRAWAVQVAGKPDELMMFVENRGFGEIDGQYFPHRSDQGHRPAAGTVTMKMTHHPQ